MPPKTAKKKKKTGNNKTKKKKIESKQFKVDGKSFDKKTKLFNGRPARIRIKKDENAPFGVIKDDPEEWTDDANTAWDELESRGLLRYGVFSLNKSNPNPNPDPDPNPDPIPNPNPIPNPDPNPNPNQARPTLRSTATGAAG